MTKKYQECTKCIMDTSDSEISFNDEGVCSHCQRFESFTKKHWFPNEEGAKQLEASFKEIKEKQKDKDYDCIIGLSGGVDSSYLIYKAKEWNLRVLAVHVDAGWNSELAVKNIETLIKYSNCDLYTYVVDWEEMRDLQRSYMLSGLANQDVPQDHVFFATLYQKSIELDIPYLITGSNYATESILPTSWGYNAMDSTQLLAIQKKFGNIKKFKSYKTVSFLERYFIHPYLKKLNIVKPLNLMPYDKDSAKEELKAIGWRDYGVKHGESVFTKFFQNHYLPHKFGYDKRRAHLSSMIVSNFMTREEALAEFDKPLYNQQELANDKVYFAKKLGFTPEELEKILNEPGHDYTEYPNQVGLYAKIRSVKRLFLGAS